MNNHDIIPSSDGEFDDFQKTGLSTLTAKATLWGVPAGVITNLTSRQSVWTTTYGVVIKPGQFTAKDIEAKSEARDLFETDLRQALQQWVQKNKAVTDADRVGMGIDPLDKPRTRVPIPSEEPLVKATQGEGHTVTVKVQPQTGGRGKPEGVNRINLRYKVGGPAPVEPEDAPLVKSATKSPVVLEFTASQAGQRVYLFVQWENSRAEPGPWLGEPVSAIIP